jgi:hypothetical protein
VRVHRGEPEIAIEHFPCAMRLSPLDPQMIAMGRKKQCAQANYLTSIRIAAASKALAGKHTEAQEAVARLHELDSSMCIANVRDGGKSLPSKPVNNETTHWCVLRHIPKSRRRDP